MRIALAQTRPARGDVAANVAAHRAALARAAAAGADVVAFPELSLTGYWPEDAGAHAFAADDARLAPLAEAARAHGLTALVGAPRAGEGLPRIGLAVLSPDGAAGTAPRWYLKQHLHADEEPWFAPGPPDPGLLGAEPVVALAICYELAVPAHAERAAASGAGAYLATVAKTARGIADAGARLVVIARALGAPTLVVNCTGPSGDGDCAGGSAAFAADGALLCRLGAEAEGLLLVDLAAGSARAV